MMTYTETGTALLATAIETGGKIQFTRVELIADPDRSTGELTHQADIALVAKKGDTTIIVKAVTDNFNFTGDYYFNQVNVYATGSDGKEILFCFQRSATCPVYIPRFDGRPVQNEISVYITVASTEAVSIVNDGVYVLQSDFEERMLQKIDMADIVQNATTRDPKKIASAAVASNLQEQISEQNTNIDTLTSRMNNFSALPNGSTTGDSELMDIRIGADGRKYDNAGEAVRGQIGELKGDLSYAENEVYANVTTPFAQGSVRPNDGGNVSSDEEIRTINTINKLDATNIIKFSCKDDYEFAVFASTNESTGKFVGVLQLDGTFAKLSGGATPQFFQEYKPKIEDASAYSFRFVMRNKNNPSVGIEPSEGNNFFIVESFTRQLSTRTDLLEKETLYEVSVDFGIFAANKSINETGGLVNSAGWSATNDFIPCANARKIIFMTQYSRTCNWNAWYKEASEGPDSFISRFTVKSGTTEIIPPTGAKYFRISGTSEDMQTVSANCLYGVKDEIAKVESLANRQTSNEYLKMLTWNVGIFNNGTNKVATADAPAQIAKFKTAIGKIDAHLFNTQEFNRYFDADNTIDAVSLMEFKYPYTVGTSGSICFSKWPVANEAFKKFDTDNTRGFRHYEINVGGKVITIINTQLSIEVDSTVHRYAEIAELVSYMQTKDYAILTGDFNVYSDTEYEPFRLAGFNLCNGGDFGWINTWPVNIAGSLWGTTHIDNIITTPNIIPQIVETFETPISDHAPIIAEFRIVG